MILTELYAFRGASLCSGDFHPDAILRREQCLKNDKKTFYNELQMYHNEYVKLFHFFV